jgi:hypothetical protein
MPRTPDLKELLQQCITSRINPRTQFCFGTYQGLGYQLSGHHSVSNNLHGTQRRRLTGISVYPVIKTILVNRQLVTGN